MKPKKVKVIIRDNKFYFKSGKEWIPERMFEDILKEHDTQQVLITISIDVI